MRWKSVRAAGWVIGPLVGIAVGTTVGLQTQAWQQSREDADMARRVALFEHEEEVPGPVDAVRELLEQDTLVVVDPLLEGRIPEEDLARAEAVLADSPVPARIAYVSNPVGSESGYTASGFSAQWSTNVGEVGHYVILWDNGLTRAGAVGLEEEYVSTRTEGQPGPALVRIAEEMVTWEAVPLPTEARPADDFDYWGGPFSGLAIAAVLGSMTVVPLFFVLRFFVGQRRRKAV